MANVRIAIGAVPEILREILIDVLATEPTLEVVALENGCLVPGSDAATPDLVVAMIDDGVPRVFRELFRVHPGLRLLGLKAHGRNAFLVELQPQELSLGELSSEDLVSTIREAVCRPDFAANLAEL